MTWLIPLPVVIPLAGAGLAVALGRRSQLQRAVSVFSLTAVLAASLALLLTVDRGALVVQVGDWPAPIGISLVADRLSALMLVISSAVTLCVLLFALAQDLALGDVERDAVDGLQRPEVLRQAPDFDHRSHGHQAGDRGRAGGIGRTLDRVATPARAVPSTGPVAAPPITPAGGPGPVFSGERCSVLRLRPQGGPGDGARTGTSGRCWGLLGLFRARAP